MSITDEYLTSERPHLDGVQRIYTLPNGYRLSLINGPMLHSYPFAWEAAVRLPDGKYRKVEMLGKMREIDLTYDTPLTDDIEVFMSDDEANQFIQRAVEWAKKEGAAK